MAVENSQKVQWELNVRKDIAKSSLTYDVVTLITFFVCLRVTPVFRKYSYETTWFLGALIVVFLGRYLFHQKCSSWSTKRVILIQDLLFFIWGSVLGAFAGFVVFKTELSWTTYFVTLAIMSLVAGLTLLTSTSPRLMIISQATVLIPSLLANALYVPGLRGEATFLLFLMFWGLCFLIGRFNYRNFQEILSQRERLQAVLNAVPGTLCWFDKNQQVLGNNQRFAEMLSEPGSPAELFAKEVRQISADLMAEQKKNLTRVFETGKKTLFFTAEKYNLGTEGLLMGVDMSQQALLQRQIEDERRRVLQQAENNEKAALIVLLSERMSAISQKLGQSEVSDDQTLWSQFHQLNEILGRVVHLQSEAAREISHEELQGLIDICFSQLMRDQQIRFSTQLHGQFSLLARPGSLLFALSILLFNSIDALNSKDGERQIDLLISGKEGLSIAVEDSGPGVDELFGETVFEPFISTKNTSGTGLAVLSDLMFELGGSVQLKNHHRPTRFVLSIPASATS